MLNENTGNTAVNPFLQDLSLNTKAKREQKSVITHQGTTLEIAEIEYVDKAAFVKIFSGSMKAVLDLPAPAHKLFLYIISSEVNMGEDEILLDPKAIEKNASFSASTFQRGLKALIEAKVLAKNKGTSHRYWINPMYFYQGDRIRLVKEYALKAGESPRIATKATNRKMDALQASLKQRYAKAETQAYEDEQERFEAAHRGLEQIEIAVESVVAN